MKHVSLSTCIDLCNKTQSCNFVNYDKNKLYCDLMSSDAASESDFVSEKYTMVGVLEDSSMVSALLFLQSFICNIHLK